MELYIINKEEIKNPCDTCSSFDKTEGCISTRGECWSKTRYDGKQSVLSHAVKVDIDEIENPFEGYFDVTENIRMAKSQGFERFRKILQSKLEPEEKIPEQKDIKVLNQPKLDKPDDDEFWWFVGTIWENKSLNKKFQTWASDNPALVRHPLSLSRAILWQYEGTWQRAILPE